MNVEFARTLIRDIVSTGVGAFVILWQVVHADYNLLAMVFGALFLGVPLTNLRWLLPEPPTPGTRSQSPQPSSSQRPPSQSGPRSSGDDP